MRNRNGLRCSFPVASATHDIDYRNNRHVINFNQNMVIIIISTVIWIQNRLLFSLTHWYMPRISLLWNNQSPLHFLKMHPPLKGCIASYSWSEWVHNIVILPFDFFKHVVWAFLFHISPQSKLSKLASGNNFPTWSVELVHSCYSLEPFIFRLHWMDTTATLVSMRVSLH